MLQKLYERPSPEGYDEDACFVKTVARLMQVEYLSVPVEEKDAEDLSEKTAAGKFPMLEFEDGFTCISEPLSIARVFSNNKLGFYGPSVADKARIDEWIDIITLNVVPMSVSLVRQARGQQESDLRAFSQQLGEFRNSLARFEKHLQLRNFLVGYQLTLADVYLISALVEPFKQFFDKKTRMAKFANLTRYMTLNLEGFHF